MISCVCGRHKIDMNDMMQIGKQYILHFRLDSISLNQYGSLLMLRLKSNNLISIDVSYLLRGIICGEAKLRQLIKMIVLFRHVFFVLIFLHHYCLTAKLGNG